LTEQQPSNKRWRHNG